MAKDNPLRAQTTYIVCELLDEDVLRPLSEERVTAGQSATARRLVAERVLTGEGRPGDKITVVSFPARSLQREDFALETTPRVTRRK